MAGMRLLYLVGLLIVSRVLRGSRTPPAVSRPVPESEIIARHISQVARAAASGDIASADQMIAHLRDAHGVGVRLVGPTDND